MGNRKHERRPVSVQVVLALENAASGLETVEGELIDLSHGGAGVLLQAAPSVSEQLLSSAGKLTVLRPEYPRIGRLPVEAVWVSAKRDSHLLRSGLRFVEEPGLDNRLSELLEAVPRQSKPLFE